MQSFKQFVLTHNNSIQIPHPIHFRMGHGSNIGISLTENHTNFVSNDHLLLNPDKLHQVIVQHNGENADSIETAIHGDGNYMEQCRDISSMLVNKRALTIPPHVFDHHMSAMTDYTTMISGYVNLARIKNVPFETYATGDPRESHHADTLRKADNAALKLGSYPIGENISLFSGIGFDPKEKLQQNTASVFHSPAHMSFTHSLTTGVHYAGNSPIDGIYHMIHLKMKANDKAYHIGHESQYPHEHETVLPAGTDLEYSGSTQHGFDEKPLHIHHFQVHDQSRLHDTIVS